MSVFDAVRSLDRRQIVRVGGLFLLAAAVLLVVDSAEDFAGGTLNARRMYRYAITSGFRDTSVDDSAVVLIRSGVEPRQVTFSNVCQQRAFLARLFKVILAQTRRPAVIVIDKYSAPDSCLSVEERANTSALIQAVTELTAAGIRVVVGQTTSDTTPDGVDIVDPIVFSRSDGAIPASILLEADPRRVVFGWQLARPDGSPLWLDTLSFAALRAYKPDILKQKARLRAFHDENAAPFVKFMSLGDFQDYTFSAIELLCGRGANARTPWRDCTTPDGDSLAKLEHRIVFVGEDSFGMDQHDTVVGPMAGVFVHANYVEAFLHGDLYRGAPWWVDVLLALFVCVIVEVIGASVTPRVWRTILIGVFLAAAYGTCILLVRLSGYFIDPAFGLVAAIAGQVNDGIRHGRAKLMERSQRAREMEHRS